MKLTDLRNRIRNLLLTVVDLPPDKVYWANQNMPKAKPPFLTLQLGSPRKRAFEEVRVLDDGENAAIVTPMTVILSLQYFGKPGTFAVDAVESMLQELGKPSVVDACAALGFSIYDAEPIIDVTGLLGNGQEFEPRAAVDLSVGYMGSTIDNEMGNIDSFDINGVIGIAGDDDDGKSGIDGDNKHHHGDDDDDTGRYIVRVKSKRGLSKEESTWQI